MMKDLVELLADYAHRAWSGWMTYLFSKGTINSDGDFILPKEYVDRWNRQINTTYKDLPDNEKESDRKEAREMLSIIKEYFLNLF